MIFSILLWVALALLIGYLGRDYKFGFWGYFAASLFFSPLLAVILLAASDKNPWRRNRETGS